MKFPFYKQFDSMDCGPSCLKMVAKYHGQSFSLQYLRQKCQIQRNGVSLLGISEAAESIGFNTIAAKLNYKALAREVPLPCIIHWNQNHFVVLHKVNQNHAWIADPAKGLIKLSRKEFESHWSAPHKNGESVGIVLMLAPSVNFRKDVDNDEDDKIDFSYIIHHFKRHKKFILQLIIGLLVGMLLQIALPFLTQSIVDVGIAGKDMEFITLVLIGQVMIFLGTSVIDFIRSLIMLQITTRINISLLTDFFIKLMKLPMSFFDVKMTGDIIQRMGDHSRVQSFFSETLLTTTFSALSFAVLTLITATYSTELFTVFATGTLVYFAWIFVFLKPRRNIDNKRFELSSTNQNVTIELIQGMQEIKLHNSERQKRWNWERVQARIFKLNVRSLYINQIQSSGALFINQGKNVIISFLSARAVVNGNLSLGEMMAVQYIIGQMNSPVQQIINFIQSLQDAKISLGRINEIHTLEDEESLRKGDAAELPNNKSLDIRHLSYKYPGYDNDYVLNDINLNIPEGKVTAIVGMSGSGKTTLLKLLLRYYDVENGEIKVGNVNINNISPSFWRSRCGVVTQEGFIFSDTISANIAVGDDIPNLDRLNEAIAIANIRDFIDSLPLGLNTKIGSQGSGISQGQKQRILIARAVYKSPDYIFLDEATNALDSNNERVILENLQSYFLGKTVIVVAHRLSTVKNADQIILLEKGRIIESGTHDELTTLKKGYYRLVKNQLELGN